MSERYKLCDLRQVIEPPEPQVPNLYNRDRNNSTHPPYGVWRDLKGMADLRHLAKCLVCCWLSVHCGCCCGGEGKLASTQALSCLLSALFVLTPQVLSGLLLFSPSLCNALPGRVCRGSFGLSVNRRNHATSPRMAVLNLFFYCDPQAKNRILHSGPRHPIYR